MRKLCVLGIVIAASLTGSGAPHAQERSSERVWTGTWQEQFFAERHFGFTREQTQISFTLVEGRDSAGEPHWVSRSVQWAHQYEQADFNSVATEDTAPDPRGFTQRRFRQDTRTTCSGGGTLDLGPGLFTDRMLVPSAEQREQMRPACVTETTAKDTGRVGRSASTGEPVGLPVVPGDDALEGCGFSEAWRQELSRGYHAGSFSVSVSAPVTAAMEVNDEYAAFVPEPGRTLSFTARVPSGKARFRFELDPEATSHFPGYATNADVDDAFFVKYNLVRLRGLYANDGPDLMFSPKHFGAQEWSRVEPLIVETATPQTTAIVTVTAMDYGAVGRLRAFVRSVDCGEWQPVPVHFGRDVREAVEIPLDDDRNLMADALDEYRGRSPGVDDDAEPKGNGTAGDGLTAFEEYRGFMTSGQRPCHDEEPADIHLRTKTGRKDLFVATNVPLFAAILPIAGKRALDLDLHSLCGRHIVDGDALLNLPPEKLDPAPRGELTGTRDARILNFTFQRPRAPRVWRGQVLSQDYPQRALVMRTFLRSVWTGTEAFPLALAIPVEPDLMGPPGATTLIVISDDDLVDIDENRRMWVAQVTHRVLHELGHGVGMPHHGDTVDNWRVRIGRKNITADVSPLQRSGSPPDFAASVQSPGVQVMVVDPGPECRATDDSAAFRSGQFVGCLTPRIVRRGQENSGEFKCPMRYAFGEHSYYEPPGVSAVFGWTGTVTGVPPDYAGTMSYGGSRIRRPLTLVADAWQGRMLRYRADRETVPAGRFCSRTTGTRINAGSGDDNHSGDAGREASCQEFLVINDTVLRGVR